MLKIFSELADLTLTLSFAKERELFFICFYLPLKELPSTPQRRGVGGEVRLP